LKEIDRVAEQTDFNGVKVLGGGTNSVNEMKIQVGANDGETIEIQLEAINTNTLKLDNFTVAGPLNGDASKVAGALKEKYGDTTALNTVVTTNANPQTAVGTAIGIADAFDSTTTVVADDNG